MTWLPIAVGIGLGVIFAFVEWQRRDRRNRALRVISIILAVAALALLGLPRTESAPTPRAPTTAVLWTSGADSAGPIPDATHIFALPSVTPLPKGAIAIPDVAYMRRHYPEVTAVHVVGDGLETFELDVLRDTVVSFTPSTNLPRPRFGSVTVPSQLHLGEPLRLQGMLEGLPAESAGRVRLHSPDGAPVETSIKSDARGRAAFELHADAVRAEGRFTWRLELVGEDEQQNVSATETLRIPVVRPTLPRILVLEQSPQVETAHLRRWLGDLGAPFTSRTTVSEGRSRFTFAGESPKEFATVDASLLAQFDVVLAELRALAALTPAEREAISAAVEQHGVGLLVSPSGEQPNGAAELFPWKLTRLEEQTTAMPSQSRSARLQWRGLAAPPEEAIELENVEVAPGAAADVLVSDLQGRPVVTTMSRGRGQLGLSLARGTWRWRLDDRPELFSSYWSFLLNRLAKRQDEPRGWTLTGAQPFPMMVDQPVELCFFGGAETRPSARVNSPKESAVLPLAEDADQPRRWRSTYWPRQAGWHRVEATGGEHLDFYVEEGGAWTGLRSARRRAATERLVALQAKSTAAPERLAVDRPMVPQRAAAALLFALFVVSSSYLWLERRRAT